MKYLFILLLFLTIGCATPYAKKDGKVVFDSSGNCYRLRSYNGFNAKEIYYLEKLEIQMSVGSQIKQGDIFK